MDDRPSSADALRAAYKNEMENWIATIRREEELVSDTSSVEKIDQWEAAHFDEEDARTRAKAAKANYEAALRKEFFGI